MKRKTLVKGELIRSHLTRFFTFHRFDLKIFNIKGLEDFGVNLFVEVPI